MSAEIGKRVKEIRYTRFTRAWFYEENLCRVAGSLVYPSSDLPFVYKGQREIAQVFKEESVKVFYLSYI